MLEVETNHQIILLYYREGLSVRKIARQLKLHRSTVYVTAKMSAKDGIWNEELRSDKAFVTALKNIVAASILATHQIANVRPDCVIVHLPYWLKNCNKGANPKGRKEMAFEN